MPVLPCRPYRSTEGKIAFIIQSDGRAIQKNCLNIISDEILVNPRRGLFIFIRDFG